MAAIPDVLLFDLAVCVRLVPNGTGFLWRGRLGLLDVNFGWWPGWPHRPRWATANLDVDRLRGVAANPDVYRLRVANLNSFIAH